MPLTITIIKCCATCWNASGRDYKNLHCDCHKVSVSPYWLCPQISFSRSLENATLEIETEEKYLDFELGNVV